MARYQLLRPAPVKVYPRRFRRQAPAASGPPTVGEEVEEEEEEEIEEGPESPDSPGSSSDEGGVSSSDDSDSESEGEELPSPAESGAATGSQSIGAAPTAISGSPSTQMSTATASQVPGVGNSVVSKSAASPSNTALVSNNGPSTLSTTTSSRPAFTQVLTSQGNNAALPQITDVPSSTRRTQIAIINSSTTVPQPSTSLSGLPLGPAQSDTQNGDSPQRSSQQQDAPIMTRTAAVAATVLGVLGALALIIGVVILIKHRKRKQNRYNQRFADDAFNPGNTGSLHVPETAHVEGGSSVFSRIGGGDGSGTGHLTQSSARSNTLFGPGSYERPETVSTERNNSRFPVAPPMPTPNPFADPPLNKAYDVLAGRPRSTTLTDRGSWVKNPFRNPESERFDPFGELKAKARKERVKHLEEARREAEREVVRGYEEKERMGLMPDGVPVRKGSGATLEGVGVLDRSAGGNYR
ncbi:hypothetical protein T440DRAFT_508659 [Plenodomus tracheiphilus IPT5]|uniref:Uncharacterized protein n=1 Tax=Plenodomus tracheiphilus IPT5 TaxID=1408161 RepID=A0A6A7B487_9PLEO|nr:hypothetical protein T440DRAFT_508659 [Plenodomus tracheiphilus IPT5]